MPVLDVLWTMLWLFLFIAWIGVVIRVIADVFRSGDIGGVAKAGWTVLIMLLPWIGVLIYLIARGDSMARREASAAAEVEQATQAYIRQAAGTSVSTADELSKLASLRDAGVISEQEFATQKAKVLT